jgi:cell division protein FtsB
MIELALLNAVLLAVLVPLVFALGFRVGGYHRQAEIAKVRAEGAHGARQLRDVMGGAFAAMQEYVELRERINR